MRGTVRWFDDDKGYGFIQPDGDDADVFVHMSAIHPQPGRPRTLAAGEPVDVEVEMSPRGPRATTVRSVADE